MTRWRMHDPVTRAAASANKKLSRAETEQHEREFAFQVRAHKLPEPVTQYLWARDLGRQFRADFAWPAFAVIVEVQGGIWMPAGVGAHSGGAAIERDIEKAQHAALLGITLVPITEKQITSGVAIDITRRVLLARGWDGKPTSHRIASHQPELL